MTERALDLEIAKILRKHAADFEARAVMPIATCPVTPRRQFALGGIS